MGKAKVEVPSFTAGLCGSGSTRDTEAARKIFYVAPPGSRGDPARR